MYPSFVSRHVSYIQIFLHPSVSRHIPQPLSILVSLLLCPDTGGGGRLRKNHPMYSSFPNMSRHFFILMCLGMSPSNCVQMCHPLSMSRHTSHLLCQELYSLNHIPTCLYPSFRYVFILPMFRYVKLYPDMYPSLFAQEFCPTSVSNVPTSNYLHTCLSSSMSRHNPTFQCPNVSRVTCSGVFPSLQCLDMSPSFCVQTCLPHFVSRHVYPSVSRHVSPTVSRHVSPSVSRHVSHSVSRHVSPMSSRLLHPQHFDGIRTGQGQCQDRYARRLRMFAIARPPGSQ